MTDWGLMVAFIFLKLIYNFVVINYFTVLVVMLFCMKSRFGVHQCPLFIENDSAITTCSDFWAVFFVSKCCRKGYLTVTLHNIKRQVAGVAVKLPRILCLNTDNELITTIKQINNLIQNYYVVNKIFCRAKGRDERHRPLLSPLCNLSCTDECSSSRESRLV